MFSLLSKQKENLIQKHNSIRYFINQSWSPNNQVALPYNIHLMPNNYTNKIKQYFLYTCYMSTYKNILEISNIKYTKESKNYFFLKPDIAYTYLTMTIKKAIELTVLKNKNRLIISSYIPHTLEILLDNNFKNLLTCSETNIQKGVFIIKINKEITNYANN